MDTPKQTIRVQLGNPGDKLFSELIFECIKLVLEGKCHLDFKETHYGHQLIESAKKSNIDIGIVVMNNLLVGSENNSIDERMANSLLVINALRRNYHIPVIAMSGWFEDPLVIEKAKNEADFFFDMPFKVEDFMAAIRTCLDRCTGPSAAHKDTQ